MNCSSIGTLLVGGTTSTSCERAIQLLALRDSINLLEAEKVSQGIAKDLRYQYGSSLWLKILIFRSSSRLKILIFIL